MAADHRVALAGGDWAVWRDVCVRSAGFGIERLDGLRAPRAVGALDRLEAHEARLVQARNAAISRCRDGVRASEGEARRRWRRAWRQLSRERVPDDPHDPAIAAALAALRPLDAAVAAARTAARTAFAADLAAIDGCLRAAAADPALREAVTWQNLEGLRTGFDPYLAGSRRGASRDRLRAQMVCRYLQRYCAKNETIGFFGPLAWGRLTEAGDAIELRPGARGLRRRHVVYEHWAMQALADSFASERGLLAWLVPRVSPMVRVAAGEGVVDAFGRRSTLPPGIHRLLTALDGRRAAGEVARALAADPAAAQWRRPEDVARALAELARRGLVVWAPRLPLAGCAFTALRDLVAGIGDGALRQRLAAILDGFDDARRRLSESAGQPDALAAGLDALQQRFAAQCGRPATRLAGRAYAGRTLVYEDCERDLDVRFGPALRRAIERPLSLVLDSVRWMTWQAARQYMDFVADAFCRCAGERSSVPLARLWQVIQSEAHVHPLIADDVAAQVQERWQAIVAAHGPRRGPAQLASEAIARSVAEAFAAPGPGWPGACVHSPDILLAADSAGAFGADRGLAVLGEVHAGFATVLQPTFVELGPPGDGLERGVAADLGYAEITPVPVPGETGRRAAYDPPIPHGLHIEFDAHRSWRPREQVAAMAEMEVARVGERLEVRTLDGRIRLPAVTFFATQLRSFCMRAFDPFPRCEHRPRVTVDRLVVAREQWVVAPATLGFAFRRDRLERFSSARRFAAAHGLPRHLFARSSRGEKPLYVDLHSPPLVDLLAKQVRDVHADADAWIALSEMLPGPGACWLRDARGHRYTSELRLTVVDTRRWREETIRWPAS